MSKENDFGLYPVIIDNCEYLIVPRRMPWNLDKRFPKNDNLGRFINDEQVVSFSCLSNSRKTAQPGRCRVSGATGANDYTPTPQEWNKN